jgi:gamma-glutamylcyclotransferase (GGCT)/AIG2-like uncharacterized protein YtfP
MKRFVVYGSLRPGEFNYDRLSHGLSHLGETEVAGYDLYDLGPYPAAVSSANKKSSIKASVIEADDHTAKFIEMMEHGAGYKAVPVDGGTMFVLPAAEGILIPSGDWRDRYKNRKQLQRGK